MLVRADRRDQPQPHHDLLPPGVRLRALTVSQLGADQVLVDLPKLGMGIVGPRHEGGDLPPAEGFSSLVAMLAHDDLESVRRGSRSDEGAARAAGLKSGTPVKPSRCRASRRAS